MAPKYIEYVAEQVSPSRIVEPVLLTRLREGLTRKTGAENIVLGDVGNIHLLDVAVGLYTKVLFVERTEPGVYLACKDALVAERL